MNREAKFENVPELLIEILEKVEHLSEIVEKQKSGIEATDDFMNVEQAAKYLGISRHTLYSKKDKKDIPYYKEKEGNRLYFKKEELENYILRGKSLSKVEIEKQAAIYLDSKSKFRTKNN